MKRCLQLRARPQLLPPPLGQDLFPALQAHWTRQGQGVQKTWQYPEHLQLSTFPNHAQQLIALALWGHSCEMVVQFHICFKFGSGLHAAVLCHVFICCLKRFNINKN